MTSDDFPGFRDVVRIGGGGYSDVYRAYQVSVDRLVAIKVIRSTEELSEDLFLAEVKALSSLGEHPNIVNIFDAGITEDGSPYLVMPYCREGSLDSLLRTKGRLDAETVLRMGVKLCSALAAVHSRNIVHGDIKPPNVLLNAFGDVLLADFGLARLVGKEHSDDRLGVTLPYAPPEAFSSRQLPGPKGDIYSLGATLLNCLTGRAPRSATTSSAMVQQILGGPPEIPADLDPELRDILTEAMTTDAAERPTATDLLLRLQRRQQRLGLPVSEAPVLSDANVGPSPLDVSDAAPQSFDELFGRSLPPPRPTPRAHPDSIDAIPWGIPQARSSSSRLEPPKVEERAQSSRTGSRIGRSPSGTTYVRRGRHNARARLYSSLRRIFAQLKSVLRSWFRAVVAVGRRLSGIRGPQIDPGAAVGGAAEYSLGQMAPDRPTGVDLLDHAPLMEGLAYVLNDPGTALPITIGVCGRWGAGKSSLMLQLAERLRKRPDHDWKRQWTPVHFDAWRFQGREAMWAGLARAIYTQAQGQLGGPLKRLRFRIRLESMRRGRLRFAGAAIVATGALVYVVGSLVRAWLHSASWTTLVGVGAGLGALSTASAYLGAIGEPYSRAISKGSLTKKFDEFLGISDAAEKDIEHLIAALTSETSGSTLVVFLDDLDRCQPALITEALAATTEIFGRGEGRRIAFILGIDIDIVTSAVDAALSDVKERMERLNTRRASEMSENFLEKVFQLSVSVDGHRRQPVERLLLGASDLDIFFGTTMDPSGAQDIRQLVAQLPASNPYELTMARRVAGLSSVDLGADSLRVMRSAIRQRRASLLSAVASRDVRVAEQLAIAALNLTPRSAKRFDNAFRLQLHVANSTPGSELTYEQATLIAVAKLTALRMFFPSIARLVDRRPGFLGEVEEVVQKDDAAVLLSSRLSELIGDVSNEAISDLIGLLRVNLPASIISTLPFDTFATTVS